MRVSDNAKANYLKHDLPHQLGHLASHLARIKTNIRAADEEGGQIAFAAIVECQFFTEWTITMLDTMQNESELMLAQELLTLGRQLTQWKLHWSDYWQDAMKRSEMVATAERWSTIILERSGLLQPER